RAPAPHDRGAGALRFTSGSFVQLPRAMGVTRLLVPGPPLRRVLLAVVHDHIAGSEDPARGPDRDPFGGLRDLLPRTVGRSPRFLAARPPRRLEDGAVVGHPVTGPVDRLDVPRLRTRVGGIV